MGEDRNRREGGVQHRSVAPEDEGLRLDRWFKRHLPQLPNALLQRWLRQGQVRVDGHRVKASARLACGQQVRIPPLAEPGGGGDRPQRDVAPPPTADEAEALRRRVLFIDADMLIIDKPAGLAVQGGTGTVRHLDGMLDALRFGRDRPRLVHRLDRDTSGVLVLARNATAAAALADAFRGKSIRKLYWAIVLGRPLPASGRIDLALAKQGGSDGERVCVAGDAGLRAATLYRTREHLGSRLSWLELEPVTGRTHQLRVHCAAINVPILGDAKYGRRAAELTGLDLGAGLHLHARAIALPCPGGGRLAVAAPLPGHMRLSWQALGFAIDSEAATLRRWPVDCGE